MRQSEPYKQQIKRRNAALAVFIALAGLLFVCERVSVAIDPHQRQRQIRRRPSAPPSEAVNKYANFTHESHGKHAKDRRAQNLKCSDCHVIPSAATPDKIAAATKPSGVLSYPYHDSCLRCHQQQFYRGDRPAICTVCHSRVAVRLTSRDVYPQFRCPGEGIPRLLSASPTSKRHGSKSPSPLHARYEFRLDLAARILQLRNHG